MKKTLLTALALVLGFTTALAVPAMRGVKKVITMADGSRVAAELRGDEFANYYQTADGRAIQQADGIYRFVSLDSIQAVREQLFLERNSARRGPARLPKTNPNSFKGTRKGLVILVQFLNGPEFIYGQKEYYDYFNKVGYNQYGMGGSVHDYFYEQSYGQFDLQFDVVGPIKVSHTESYYTTNNDSYVGYMIEEAVKKADSQVNYKDYDWDGDGFADQVYIIYQGYGEAQGAENTIWPHEHSLTSSIIGKSYMSQDGVRVNTYACSSELHGNGVDDPGKIDGIGTACHEFSHCMGIPDFYDTRSEGTNWAMDVWDLMDYGCYNGDHGYVPCGYTSYERMFAGWLTPIELDQPTYISDMPCLSESPTAYIIYNKANPDEFYMLENHQKKNFDSAIYGHGLMVLHVDYDEGVWSSNKVNNTPSRQRMTLIVADGIYGATGNNADGDLFPGSKNVTALTDDTKPAAILYTANTDGAKLMHAPITDIDETNGLISFSFKGGKPTIGTPTSTAATNVDNDAMSFTANWQSVSGATGYDIRLTRTTEVDPWDTTLLAEDFTECYSKVAGTSKDVGGNLDDYLASTGWTGQCLYRSPYRLRVGKSTQDGWIQTRVIQAPEMGVATFVIGVLSTTQTAAAISMEVQTDKGVSLGEVSLGGIPSALTTPVGSYGYFCFPIDNWTYGDFRILLKPQAGSPNFYLGFLGVFDGEFSWEDINGTASEVKAEALLSDTGMLPQLNGTLLDAGEMKWEQSIADARRRASVVEDAGLFTTQATSYTFRNMKPGVYTYSVRARGAKGTGYWSEGQSVELINTTGISTVSPVAPAQGAIYDLSGRRVERPIAGHIYIQNGRKYMMR